MITGAVDRENSLATGKVSEVDTHFPWAEDKQNVCGGQVNCGWRTSKTWVEDKSCR
jgi:hypothetical protein